MTLSIKTCGLSHEATIDAVLARGATHLGFIFFPASPRHVAPEDAARLVAHAKGRARTVAVTVDADDAALDRIVAAVKPDMLQLHGRETPERVKAVRARHGLPVIKAVAVRGADDLARARAHRDVADVMLFDAKDPDAALPGGNGVAFDWSLLAGWDGPFWLSGGLHAGNVARALTELRPAGLDLSSGLESAPGVKDAAAIDRFFDALDQATGTGARDGNVRDGNLRDAAI